MMPLAVHRRVRVVAAPIAVGLFAAFTGLVTTAPSGAAAWPVAVGAGVEAGSTVARYRSDCATCHGADGRGTPRGPTLVGQGPAGLDYALSTGRMPLAAGGRATTPGRPPTPQPDAFLGDPAARPQRRAPAYPPGEIAALVAYVIELTGTADPAIPSVSGGDVAEGGVQFRLQCAACHSWAGTGGALVDRAAPRLDAATPVQIGEAVRSGPGQMPAFGSAALSDEQLASVVAYVRYLDAPRDRGGWAIGHLGPVGEGALALAALGVLLVVCRRIGERR